MSALTLRNAAGPRRRLQAALGSLTLLLACGCTAPGPASSPVASAKTWVPGAVAANGCRLGDLPRETDVPLHGQVLGMAGAGPHIGIEHDPAIARYLEQIAAPLRRAYGGTAQAAQVFAVIDERYNAWTMPDHTIYVSTAVLRRAQTDDEIAALLAHEMAHVACRHAAVRTTRDREGWLLGMLAQASVFTRALYPAVGLWVTQEANQDYTLAGFSREQETEADLNAVDALVAAGYNPAGMFVFLRRFQSAGSTAEMSLLTGPAHASPEERMEAIHRRLNELHSEPAHSATRERLQQMQKDSEAHVQCELLAFEAYRTLGYPFALAGDPQLARDAAAVAQAEELLRRCSANPSRVTARTAAPMAPTGVAVADLRPDVRELWYVLLGVEEVAARRRALAHLPPLPPAASLSDLSEVPEYFALQSIVLAARAYQMGEVRKLTTFMSARYGSYPELYPLDAALEAWGVQVARSRNEWPGVHVLGARCFAAMNPPLQHDCDEAVKDPKKALDNYWRAVTGAKPNF